MGLVVYCRPPLQRTVINADGNEVPMSDDYQDYLEELEEAEYEEAMFLESLSEEKEEEREPWDTEDWP